MGDHSDDAECHRSLFVLYRAVWSGVVLFHGR